MLFPHQGTSFSGDGFQDADTLYTLLNMPSHSTPTTVSGLSDSASRSHRQQIGQITQISSARFPSSRIMLKWELLFQSHKSTQ